MRMWIAAFAGAGLAITPAFAQTPVKNLKMSEIVAPANDAEVVLDLAPGDEIAIACDAIEKLADKSDVRVVLTLAEVPGETTTGYKKVLATDEQLDRGAVRVKIPHAPDLENHTVNLDVYVTDKGGNKDCNGGHYKIVATDPSKPKG